MRLTVLASGSGGNSILVEAEHTRLLVDAGLSAREIAKRIERSSLSARLEDVQALCVTHEHNDHASGAATLGSAGIALYATAGTARAARLKNTQLLGPVQETRIGCLTITPVLLPHDAVEPIGLVLTDERGKVGILTDCGYPSVEVAAAFAGCDLLVLEANHELHLLRSGGYQPTLKRRIGGRRGHLSNEQAGEILRLRGRPGPKVLILAHLSEKSNRPRLARTAVERAIFPMGMRPKILIASQSRPTASVAVGKGRVSVLAEPDARQLSLSFPD